MEIRTAFEQLISQFKWYEKAGLKQNYANMLKHRYKKNQSLTRDMMTSILIKAGYKIIVEEQWKEPPPEPIIVEKIVRRKARKRKEPKPKEIVIVRTLIEPEIVKNVTIKTIKPKKERVSTEKANPNTTDKVIGKYNDRKVYEGPRGGKYYINKNGNKTYIDDEKVE